MSDPVDLDEAPEFPFPKKFPGDAAPAAAAAPWATFWKSLVNNKQTRLPYRIVMKTYIDIYGGYTFLFYSPTI